MAQCGLRTEAPGALRLVVNPWVLVGGSCYPKGDIEVNPAPPEPRKAGGPWCVALSPGEELKMLWPSQDIKGHR